MGNEDSSVLIVDNEPQVCRLPCAELSEHGFACTATMDSLRAMQLLSERRFRVLIADVAMPRAGGLDLLAHVRNEGLGCKVVLITGVSRREYLSQAFLLGAFDYVEKPFKRGELVEVVTKALRAETDRPVLFDRATAVQCCRANPDKLILHDNQPVAGAMNA